MRNRPNVRFSDCHVPSSSCCSQGSWLWAMSSCNQPSACCKGKACHHALQSMNFRERVCAARAAVMQGCPWDAKNASSVLEVCAAAQRAIFMLLWDRSCWKRTVPERLVASQETPLSWCTQASLILSGRRCMQWILSWLSTSGRLHCPLYTLPSAGQVPCQQNCCGYYKAHTTPVSLAQARFATVQDVNSCVDVQAPSVWRHLQQSWAPSGSEAAADVLLPGRGKYA